MGNIFGKKRVFTEELENLTHQMKGYKEDIERTSESRRMLLWYLTLLNFFLSTSICGYAWFYYDEKQHKIILSVSGFIAGFLLLLLSRKLVNGYYEWRLNRKRKALDDLIEKKRNILETVKETKTFKEAKEILEKYDDMPVEKPPTRPSSQVNTPTTERRGSRPPPPPPGTPLGPPPNLRMRGPPPTPAQRPQGPGSPQERPAPTPNRNPQNIPMSAQMPPPNVPIRPVRPFHQVPNTTVDKIVDYFFSDGPNNRMALICSNCHGHNGMAMPEEFDYLAYVCFICKHFNPAKKLRTVSRPFLPPQHSSAHEEHKPEDKDSDHGKESPAPKSETATEDEFDLLPSQHSTDEEETDK